MYEKKTGADKPRNNNFKKKETYYRPKQEEVKQNNQFNSFAKMQDEFRKMRENNEKI